jgi:general secretion pathway protein D
LRWSVVLAVCIATAGCSGSEPRKPDFATGGTEVLGAAGSSLSAGHPVAVGLPPISRSSRDKQSADYIELGTGTFVDANARKQVEFDDNGRTVSLNFVDADLQEFIRVVFEEILKATVVVDPALKGRVTVRTATPVTRAVALDMVRQAVQANGASLTQSGSIYRVAARGDQRNARQLGDSVRIVPVRYIGTEEAKTALAPFTQSGVEITAGSGGRYLTLAGAPADLDNLEQVLATLDVDQMSGMSFALMPLREAGATFVANELNQMFAKSTDGRGFRTLPITRMNAVLIISPQPSLLKEARKWISHLDHADQDGRRIYVYQIQNRRATEIAKLLANIVDAEKSPSTQQQDRSVAPQLTPALTSSPSRGTNDPFQSFQSFPSPATTSSIPGSGSGSPSTEPVLDKKPQGPRVTADVSTNSIVVIANVEEWKVIETALRRLDVMSAEVLIEATVAEVTLNDSLSHGVRWFFQKGPNSVSLTDSTGTLNTTQPGFNYVFGLPNARVALNALETVTDVEIVSSPALTVLDNQTAKLQVGDQVPVATSSAQSVVTTNAPLVTNIDYKDTGVILAVTPHVNASGLVMLDISQEVSNVVSTTTSTLNSPTIEQRRINSSVAVRSGMEIVLGGLISTNRTKENDGIPFLMGIPILGNAFKSQATSTGTRTELLIFLRPTVMGTSTDIRNVVDEIKSRMSAVRGAIGR